MFETILIANRGEIACRIIRTAKRMGIRCIAIYSEIDANALHVKMADAAYLVGAAPSRESYLNINAIINAAKQSGAQAIHPGYGFLSENAEFAEKCLAANIIFIGPSPYAIRMMGDKIEAKKIMSQAGIPVVPGYHEVEQDNLKLIDTVKKMGLPVLLKAAAGGGGKGMRLVQHIAELEEAIVSARREAKASFGDERIFVEKYLADARHIEAQVFADTAGNVVHLYERDCSMQRRHQKVIEETPAPLLPSFIRDQLCNTAVAAARAINYVGAGTIEFLVADNQFYFMEMNTRLQVEHPITELTNQVDLVEWQLRIAANEPLPLCQEQIKQQGHAIELRIYAENPHQQFLPSIGKLVYLKTPEPNNNIRIDTGVAAGDEISMYYDPLVAKLIAYGHNGADALHHAEQALAAYQVVGVITNIDFLQAILKHPEFIAGKYNTQFISKYISTLLVTPPINSYFVAAAALYLLLREKQHAQTLSQSSADQNSPWWQRQHWRLNLNEPEQLELKLKDQIFNIKAWHTENKYTFQFAEISLVASGELAGEQLIVHVDDETFTANVILYAEQLHLFIQGQHLIFTLPHLKAINTQSTETTALLTAPMPGTVTAVNVTAGQTVSKGQSLLVLEAMKMEHTIYSPADGTIKAVCYQPGDVVQEGAELIKLKE